MKINVGYKGVSRYGEYRVVSVIDGNNFIVRFNDGFEKLAQRKEVVNGVIKNPYHPHVCGVGFVGQGEFTCKGKDGANTTEYEVWNGLFKRCYNKKRQEMMTPSYAGCTVHADWHNFQKFAKWFTSHPNYGKGYALDKDLTILGNKEYSEEACYLVPVAINSLLCDSGAIRGKYPVGVHWCNTRGKFISQCNTGEKTAAGKKKQTYLGKFDNFEEAFSIYKATKEKYVKQVANKYRSEISDKIYENLMNYEVKNDAAN